MDSRMFDHLGRDLLIVAVALFLGGIAFGACAANLWPYLPTVSLEWRQP